MAFEIAGITFAREASTDLSASQYCGVTLDTNSRLVLPSADGQAIGILQNKPASLGAEGSVMVTGVSKMVASAAINPGQPVGVTAAGQAKVAVSATGKAIGVALTPAAASGEIISVLLGGIRPGTF